MARLNLTIPDPLYERLERLRDRVNVSKVCAVALTKELDMLEGTMSGAVTEDNKVQRLVQRFLRKREAKERWYQRGRHDGEQWAIERATLEELRNIGEEWEEENIEECDDFDDIADEDEYPTLNIRELLKRWVASDRAEGIIDREEADWRAYLLGWFHGARDLWKAARSSLASLE